ncbi:MAG: hypothetical protein ACE5PM_04080 [Candidatus Hydrothermarchaeales archaeon]
MAVKFGAEKLLIDQFFDHHGMMEIYAHIYASIFLFLASLVAVYVLYKILVMESPYTWSALTVGMIAVGFIGLGEAAEHFFPLDPFSHDLFHYLHMVAAPVALFFLYRGSKEFIEESSNASELGTEGRIKPMSSDTIMAIFGGMVILVVVLAMMSETPWDPYIEGPFIYLTLIPTLVLAYMLLQQARHTTESIVMVFIPIIAVAVSLLVFDIMLGRLMDIWGLAPLYVITHVVQNVLHVATGTILLLFSITTYRANKLGIIYVRGERPKYEAPPHKKIPAEDYF